MDRFADQTEDLDLKRALEDLADIKQTVRRTRDKTIILQSALSQIGAEDLKGADVAEGAYAYIALDIGQFFELMFTLEEALSKDPDYQHSDKPHRPGYFLEAGCGIGRNLQILRATDRFAFDKICGFDIVPEYVAAGRKYFNLGKDIWEDDALTFDYGSFDVIYFYRLFHDDEKQTAFETRLIETSKRGAYIVASLASSLESSRSLVAIDEINGIWKRI